MSFKKLALVSAMFAATSGAFAMEALDEEAMAATTGQDGISIGLSTSANLDVILHDKDGLATTSQAGYANSGAILISGISLAGALGVGNAAIDIDIDAGATAAGALNDATLNIGITVGAVQMGLGTLTVANSAREGGAGWGIDAGSETAALINLGTIELAGATMNIQLGHEPQGDLIAMNTTLTGGLSLSSVGLNDINSLGSISVGTLVVNNAGASNDLVVDLGINATATGLTVRVDQMGDAVNGLDVTMANIVLGGGLGIGDVEINGLNLNGDTITISGH